MASNCVGPYRLTIAYRVGDRLVCNNRLRLVFHCLQIAKRWCERSKIFFSRKKCQTTTTYCLRYCLLMNTYSMIEATQMETVQRYHMQRYQRTIYFAIWHRLADASMVRDVATECSAPSIMAMVQT